MVRAHRRRAGLARDEPFRRRAADRAPSWQRCGVGPSPCHDGRVAGHNGATDVFVSSATAATVNYQVLLNGKVALPNAVGTAVFENGVWKVSDSTMCGLFGLMGGAKIPGC